MNHRFDNTSLPAQPFFSTPQQRLALARQRYFEEGVRPSGLVSEGVLQSWSRCSQARRDPREVVVFEPVTASRVHSTLARSHLLLQAAGPDLSQLETTLAGTGCSAILTDPHGIVVHATRSSANPGEVLLPLAARVGVNVCEEHAGTGAPAVTLRTGQPSLVLGGEHFFGQLQVLHCAAAPIRDVRGHVAAVLDLSIESRPFGFDAAALVALCATTIENRLLQAQSREHIVLRLQTTRGLLGTPMEGLAGLASDGSIAWVNSVAARLLGLSTPGAAHADSVRRADTVLALDLHAITQLTREREPRLHRLPSGLALWLTAQMQSRDGAAQVFPVDRASRREAFPPADPPLPDPSIPLDEPAPTLRDNDQHLITRTVAACGGNISKAARKLGVSRGLIYRHIRQAAPS